MMEQIEFLKFIVSQAILIAFMVILVWKLWTDWAWVKSFFADSAEAGKASSKRLLGILVVSIFVVTYMRIALATQEVMDIPVNWSYTILGVLGIGVADNYLNRKAKNGNGHNVVLEDKTT